MDAPIHTVAKPAFDDTSTNARSWRIFADAINCAWRKSAGDFIECGRLLDEANAELPRDAFNAMVKSKLDFVPSVARKLIRIAANRTLCSPGNKLPPAWTILYQLSQLPEATLKAALADGSVHPGMSRAAAIALKPSKKTTAKAKTPASGPTALGAIWQAASPAQRRAFLDQLGRAGLCAVMSPALLADFRDHVVGLDIAGASEITPFAKYATGKLHAALRCAEQPESDTESRKMMAVMLNCIAKQAETKNITRSAVVVAEGGKSRGRK